MRAAIELWVFFCLWFGGILALTAVLERKRP